MTYPAPWFPTRTCSQGLDQLCQRDSPCSVLDLAGLRPLPHPQGQLQHPPETQGWDRATPSVAMATTLSCVEAFWNGDHSTVQQDMSTLWAGTWGCGLHCLSLRKGPRARLGLLGASPPLGAPSALRTVVKQPSSC